MSMKINQISQITKMYETTSIKKITPQDTKIKHKDDLKISETAKYFQLAFKAAKDAPDIRTEKVEKIKAQIDAGTYNVSAQEVASKIASGIFNKTI